MSTQSESTISPKIAKRILEIFPEGAVFFDLETTGLSPLFEKIVEFAGIKISSKGVEVFQTLINPEKEMLERIIEIHGITNEMVSNAPTEAEISPKIIDFIGELPLIAHNAKFDIGFLICLQRRQQQDLKDNKVYCSCTLSRKINKNANSHKLSMLSEQFEIALDQHHRALDDTKACLEVFYHLSKMNENTNEIRSNSYLFSLNDFTTDKNVFIPSHLSLLETLVPQGKEMEIKYKGGSKSGEYRPIKPISVLPLPDGDVLYAFCLNSKLHKFYKLKKITEVRER